MKNVLLNNSNATYFSGWDIAIHNYDTFEIESIKQLVNLSKDSVLPELASFNEQDTDYFILSFKD